MIELDPVDLKKQHHVYFEKGMQVVLFYQCEKL